MNRRSYSLRAMKVPPSLPPLPQLHRETMYRIFWFYHKVVAELCHIPEEQKSECKMCKSVFWVEPQSSSGVLFLFQFPAAAVSFVLMSPSSSILTSVNHYSSPWSLASPHYKVKKQYKFRAEISNLPKQILKT